MNLKNLSKIALASSLFLLGSASLAFAAGSYSNCQVIYGGGEVCNPSVQFTIDKKVQSPTKGGQMVDNLGANDAKFSAGQQVPFEITVQNTGNQAITLNVVDILPSYLSYVSGGTFDANTKQISNSVTLNPNDTKTFNIVAKVVDNASLPNQSVTCVTNVAKATDGTGVTAEDDAQLCIQKGLTVQPQVPTKTIPNTGPEAIALFLLPPLGAAGLYIRWKTGL